MVVDKSTDSAQQIPVSFTLNGVPAELNVQPHIALLDVLRDTLKLKGAKRSCDMQACGACTVLVDGRPVSSCTLLAFEVRNREVLTIEGMAEATPSNAERGELHPLMQSFIEEAALQCGYCTPGMLLTAKSLLDQTPHPTEAQIKEYMSGNICRCTGYKKIVEAITEAAEHTGR